MKYSSNWKKTEPDYLSWVHLFAGFPNWITMVLKQENDKPQLRNRLYHFCFSCFRRNLALKKLFSMLRARTKKTPRDSRTGLNLMTPGYRIVIIR